MNLMSSERTGITSTRSEVSFDPLRGPEHALTRKASDNIGIKSKVNTVIEGNRPCTILVHPDGWKAR